MNNDNRTAIVITPDTCSGQPRIDGRRITVIDILRQLAEGISIQDIADDFKLTELEVVEAVKWCADYIEKKF
jgi:uncharacterized protein (DUF433 family)